MRDLNPYDTGERATPVPWVSTGSDFTAIHDDRDPDDFGRVDFDDDEGRTVATIYLSRRDDGGYTAHIIPMDDDLTIEWHGAGSAKIHEDDQIESDAPLVCDECPSERGVQTYYDNHSDVEVELCPSCYHDAVRSGADLS